ncbi:kinase-like domain-containing protein [Lentinula raphanica]|nr:kinase-like domain-containing protein [Lentinula raphanica]
MPSVTDGSPPSPPRAPTIKYSAPHGTRWDKEKAAAGGAHAFDLPSDPKVLGPWIIGECVGKGASGRVKIAKHRYTNQLAAVKILPRAPLDSSRNSITTQEAKTKKHSLGIEREITMMKLMNHPNILRIYDVYEGPKELFLVLEYVEGGELFDYLVNRGRLPEPDAICFFKQIIYGLNYAHTFSIIHRDLKPENILISSLSPPSIKIVDWGMAAFAPPSLQLETSCGSPHYASPEIVNGYKYTGNATDIWSCGVILYALLTGRLPFDDKDVKVLLGKVKVGKYEMPSYIDRSAQDLLSKMLVINVKERITIPEILAHPWLNTSPAALRQMSLASSSQTDPPLSPVLPPSPSTLARPISDPSSIESEILFSLKVIWGRHADLGAILKDLSSPAGNGIHTKAFYWLLRRHHEEAERLACSSESDNDSGIGMGPGSVTFNLGWELDTSGLGCEALQQSRAERAIEVHNRQLPERRGLTDASRSPKPTDTLLSPLMARELSSAASSHSSRSRSNSPHGPRLPNVPRSSHERHSTDSAYTIPHQAISRPVSHRSSSLPNSSGSSTACSMTSTNTVHAPSPVRAVSGIAEVPMEDDYSAMEIASTPPPVLPPLSPVQALPFLTAPKTNDPDLQKELDGIAEQVNRLSLRDAATDATTIGQDMQAHSRDYRPQQKAQARQAPHQQRFQSPKRTRRQTVATVERGIKNADKENKENSGIGDDSWSYVVPDDVVKNALGDIGNYKRNLALNDGKGKKDKKNRPPPLEIQPPTLNHKRSTISALGSPIALSPPTMNSTSTKTGLSSPVVGEFKGWLSGLFSWSGKNASANHILYSTADVTKTRRNLVHLLASFGVLVDASESDADDNLPLRCKVEELPSDALAHLGMKPVKFRIELVSICEEGGSGITLGGGSKSPHLPLSPLLSPNLAAGFVHGFASAMIVIQEKGSTSTFKAIWKKLKDVYDDGCGETIHSTFSPVMTSTPVVEPPRCIL